MMNTNMKTRIKELETASNSYYKAEQFANSIPPEKMLSIPNYVKENIKKQTILSKKSKTGLLFHANNGSLFHYSLRVCFTMFCSLLFLFSDYTSNPQYYRSDRSIRFEQMQQPNQQVQSLLQITNSKEDSYYD